ncbi:MAG: hypothetical protein KAI50_04500 [Desulfobacterales bacterium]|nr:hypothetical protein [Desulfobacterales bacterium]
MIRKKDSNVKEQKRSDSIPQQCDLVEELSNEDLENVAGGTLNDMVMCGPTYVLLYGIFPERPPIINGIFAAKFRAVNSRF